MTELAPDHHDDADRPLLLPVEEVSRLTHLAPRTVWRYASAGRMPAPIRVGNRKLWRRQDLEEWVERGCPGLRR